MSIVELVPFREPCVEASKMRSDGKFHRWCTKHHHWLNDAPAQRTVADELLAGIQRAEHLRARCTCGSGLADGLCANCWPQ